MRNIHAQEANGFIRETEVAAEMSTANREGRMRARVKATPCLIGRITQRSGGFSGGGNWSCTWRLRDRLVTEEENKDKGTVPRAWPWGGRGHLASRERKWQPRSALTEAFRPWRSCATPGSNEQNSGRHLTGSICILEKKILVAILRKSHSKKQKLEVGCEERRLVFQ